MLRYLYVHKRHYVERDFLHFVVTALTHNINQLCNVIICRLTQHIDEATGISIASDKTHICC